MSLIARFRRTGGLDGERAATALRALAAVMRSGAPPFVALEAWGAAVPADLAAAVSRAGRRLALGDDPSRAVASEDGLGAAAPALARCLSLHGRIGGSLPLMLDALAASLQDAEATAKRSRAVTSGARLSGRLVAGLPLAFVPLMPGARSLGAGPAGFALLVLGVALAAAGLWWIGKLVPRAGGDDPAAAFADDVAVALDAGADLVPALAAIAALPPPGLSEELAAARAHVALGGTWIGGLEKAGAPLASVAQVLRRSASCGVTATGPLREWSRTRRAEVRTELDRALQRAPVLMVVPLTVCVLPAFALLAFGPLLLGALEAR